MRNKSKWALIIILVVLMVGMVGCERKHEIHSEGYYQYIIIGKENRFPLNREDEYVAIVGLTELGQEQRVLEIPRDIDGKEVICLGYDVGGTMTGTMYYHLESPILERMYIHDNILKIETEALYKLRKNDLNLLYCGTNPIELHDIVKVSVYKEIYDEVDEHFYIMPDGRKLHYWMKADLIPANVVFMNNFSREENRGYYWLDNIKNGEKITEPLMPEREGYLFVGWYTDAELKNIWDFSTEIEIEEDSEFRLYAGWQTI